MLALSLCPLIFIFRGVLSALLIASVVLPIILFFNRIDVSKLFLISSFISTLILAAVFCFFYTKKSFDAFTNGIIVFFSFYPSFLIYKHSKVIVKKRLILQFYSISIVALSLFVIGFFIYQSKTQNFDRYTTRIQFEYFTDFHGTYLNLWIGLAFAVIWIYLIDKTKEKLFSIPISVLILLVYLVSILITSSTNILIALAVVMILSAYFNYYTLINRFRVYLLFLIIAVGSTTLFYIYRLDLSLIYTNVRYLIYYSSWQIFIDAPLQIRSPEFVQESLNWYYSFYGFFDAEAQSLNSHNQYLDFLLIGGIPLFCSFLYILFYKLFCSLRKKDYLYFSVTLIFAFGFLTENILSRQYGIFIYVFFELLLAGNIFNTNKTH